MKHLQAVQDQEKIEKIGTFYKRVSDANLDYFMYWKEHTFLHWDFWLSLFLTIFPWVLWWFVHKRQSRARLLMVGLFMIIITSWLDFIGTILGLWIYSGKTVPSIPSYIPWDFCVFPVIVMLLIQFKPHIMAWKKGVFFAVGSAYIGEPLFIWLGFYIPLHWHSYYSVPIYFLIYLVADKLAKAKSFDPID